MDELISRADAVWQQVVANVTSLQFYAQLAIVAVALVAATVIARLMASRVGFFRVEPDAGVLLDLRKTLHGLRVLLRPIMAVVALGIATPVAESLLGSAWLVRAAQGLALVYLVYSIASHFIRNEAIILILKWVGVPIAVLYTLGLHDEAIAWLDSIAIDIGNIHITLYAILRTVVFGVVLFWLGRISSATGQQMIRTQPALDTGTREVIAKLFEIAVFAVIVLLLLNVMGIDLTALAVFGGALGVGLGFGLQQIASNFISGIIILIDRSISIGDYIELEDGRAGTLRELSMRSATLETFDGKDIMVPNERFITSAFTNWTHYDKKQRYSLELQVAYDTDLPRVLDILRDVVASHPQVLSGEGYSKAEQPDAEIKGFGDSGVDILIEYWIEGVDDGENRVDADLLLMIWTALQTHGVEIPFPQREIRVLGEGQVS